MEMQGPIAASILHCTDQTVREAGAFVPNAPTQAMVTAKTPVIEAEGCVRTQPSRAWLRSKTDDPRHAVEMLVQRCVGKAR